MIYNASISFAQQENIVSYEESFDIIANPERGLQKYSITNYNYNTTTNYSNINESTITGWRTGAEKVTVIYRYFMLDAYMNSNISQTYLDNMHKDFGRIRNAGLKCIVRFAYTDEITVLAQQPSKAQILSHINQLGPVLQNNKDVILSVQAGFIGTWGEWYYTNSTEFGTEGNINSTQWQNRKEIIEAMLSATPLEIPIQVRYPQIKKTMYGTSQLNENTAYQHTANARIGFFNDAFLNEWGDMGTYEVDNETQTPVGTADYTYLSNETTYTIMSGETNGVNAPRTNGENAIYEMDLTNFTTLNRDYYTENWTNWINSNHYNEILRRLGYRFVLRNSSFTLNDKNLAVEINLENVGFANPSKHRDVYLVLKNSSTGITHSFLINSTDIRTWRKNVKITQNFNLSDLSEGTYICYLNMPDKETVLYLRPEYSIQFANTNLWENTTGYNQLNQTVVVSFTTSNKDEIKQTQNLIIYPTDTENYLYVKNIDTNAAFSVSITNMIGETIYKKEIDNSLETEIMIDISSFKKGFYFLTTEQNNNRQTTKIIKR